jgi:hypothetical protein
MTDQTQRDLSQETNSIPASEWDYRTTKELTEALQARKISASEAMRPHDTHPLLCSGGIGGWDGSICQGTIPLKPKQGLNGPPVCVYNRGLVSWNNARHSLRGWSPLAIAGFSTGVEQVAENSGPGRKDVPQGTSGAKARRILNHLRHD